jgi:peptide/nickel transport system ATP-binding protein
MACVTRPIPTTNEAGMTDIVSMNTARPLLQVKNLTVDFPLRTGTFRAVDDLSFAIEPGKTLCVVGESGSGKSVTARSILQIVDAPGRITAGSITLNAANGSSIDIVKLNPRGRQIRSIRGRDIAMIFQEPMASLSPVHTVGDQIMEALRLHTKMSKAEARAETISLLKQVEIPSPEKAIDRYAFQYSGGMRQRAMIAMALACKPQLLIADEPTTALDVTVQAQILRLLLRLREQRGMSLMLITHDFGVVAGMVEKVNVMYGGEIVETGPVDDVFARPRHDYTRALLEAVPRLDAAGQGR